MDKKIYVDPDLEIIKFRFEDILTASGGGSDGDDGGDNVDMGGGIVLPDDEW